LPPAGKFIKIVAKALSDEHVFNLESGRDTKAAAPVRASGGYSLSPTGQPHSALIANETVSLVIYTGEPTKSCRWQSSISRSETGIPIRSATQT